MPTGRKPELSPGDWSVLGVLSEGPTHGFALARVMASEGSLGRIWTLPRPLVYRSLQKLGTLGLVAVSGSHPSEIGPNRTVMTVTPEGRRGLVAWLGEPVPHVRDIRSLLLLKLALLNRSGSDAGPLLQRQRALLVPQVDALRTLCETTDGFESVIVSWRLEATDAVLRFIERAEASLLSQRSSGTG